MGRTKQAARKRKGTDGNAAVAATKVAKIIERTPRHTELPIQCAKMILEEIQLFFKNKVTDKWLCFEKQKLMRNHPGNSQESIDELLLSSLSKNKKYNGRDLQQLISTLRDATIVESTKVSSYISIGITNIAQYLKQGGSYHCIVSSKAKLYDDVLSQESVCNVPLFVITGLTDALSHFTELEEEKFWKTIAFKKVENNPFDKLVKLIADKIPNEFSPSILKWKQSIDCANTNSENGKDDISSNGEKVLENSKNEENVLIQENKDLHEKEAHVHSTSDPSNFTQSLPQIQEHHQPAILQKIESFISKFPNPWVVEKKRALKKENPELSAEDIENILFKSMLCLEEFVGEDIVGLLSSVPREGTDDHPVVLVRDIYRHVKDGGLFHFILYCDSATAYINRNIQFQSLVTDIPLCSIKGLSTVVKRIFFVQRINPIIGFRKVKDNPLHELVKFIAGKMPNELVSLMAPLEESSDSVAKK